MVEVSAVNFLTSVSNENRKQQRFLNSRSPIVGKSLKSVLCSLFFVVGSWFFEIATADLPT